MEEEKAQFCEDYVYKMKVLILGALGVGKSTLISTYLHGDVPKCTIMKQDLSFHCKKLQYQLSKRDEEIRYDCRFHFWDVGSTICNAQPSSKFMKNHLFDHTLAIILIYRDKESLRYINQTIIKILPKKILSLQNVYLLHLFSNKKTIDQDLKIAANNICDRTQMIFHSLAADDPNAVRLFFDKIRDKLMDKILKGNFPFDSVVLRDRSRKIVQRDFNVAQNEYFEKRYNRCC